ncbi:hypothetical protein [Edwardsiella piscicida]|uniref:hypothetical protein n=1 Tax=Edwardsiella piscicida TaxID=1263550 RepID=UPI00370DE052
MGGGHWRMGIDIQPAQLIAVALSARRDGIQLRGWWRLPLTAAPDRDGLSPSLPAALAALRASLVTLAAASPAAGAGRAPADASRAPAGL